MNKFVHQLTVASALRQWLWDILDYGEYWTIPPAIFRTMVKYFEAGHVVMVRRTDHGAPDISILSKPVKKKKKGKK